MTRHFDYLTKDDEGDFFQKVALDQSGVRANQRPVAMTKTASQASPARTSFEKIAARLDRDLEFLKAAGECGISAGMQKRANAYIDVLMSNVALSAEEFGEVFDKVASVAIQTDLEAAWEKLAAEIDPTLLPWLEWQLNKLGSELTKEAILEKEAVFGLIARGARFLSNNFSRAKGLASAAKAGTKEIAHDIGRGWTGGVGVLRHTGAENKMKFLADEIKRTKAPGAAARAYKENLAKQYRAAHAKNIKGLEEIEASGVPMTPAQQAALAKARAKARAGAAGRASSSPAPAGGAPTPAAPVSATTTGAASTNAPAARASSAGGGKIIPISKDPNHGSNKGTGTDGPAPQAQAQPKAKADTPATPDTPPPPGGADGKPPGFIDAWKKVTEGGWSGLSPEERGVLIRGGVNAALVARVVTGHGAVTGGEGLI